MTRLLALLLMLIPCAADAIVIRDDVSDTQYRVAASVFPALADLPGEGHGVLIAPQWVVTAAHAVSWQDEIAQVTLNGVPRSVKRVVVYPGYQNMPQKLIELAMSTGDASAAIQFHTASNDIAMIELSSPVRDVTPAELYTGSPAVGTVVEIFGKGATGTGLTGMDSMASHRTVLRRAFTTITAVQDRWLCYTFAKPPAALPLQGTTASGDSGSPVLIDVGGQQQVAGLASWQFPQGDARKFVTGVYGQITYNVRPSYYLKWIDGVMAADSGG